MEKTCIDILNSELVPALGCTEPIAVAYAAAKARQVLGTFPEHISLLCSGNIIKNVKGVSVPNSGGLKGVDISAVLGVVGGDPESELEVLENVTEEDVRETKRLISEGFIDCKLQPDVENLYIVATVTNGSENASVTIINRHTYITEIRKNGEVIFSRPYSFGTASKGSTWDLSIEKILAFAETVEIEKVADLIRNQMQLNSAIADAGLGGAYGESVGKTLLETACEGDVRMWARARAAAGSDARMGGCSLPVVINSGSGNQGMTVSLPVIEYAKAWKKSDETLIRALLISNLVSIHLKHYIGSLSAFCGAVTAACGTGAAITYMAGGTYEQLSNTIINTLANVGGIVCDGAKASCAAKIASAVEAAILGYELSMRGNVFRPGEGIVRENIEETIRSMGYVGRVGMKDTDVEILNIMLDNIKF